MNKLKKLRKFLKIYKLDSYIVPKNDEYFNEYVSPSKDRLKFISNFSGSLGFGIVTMKKNYLFVDGRYTLQAGKESGKNFQIKMLYKVDGTKLIKRLKKKLSQNIIKLKIGEWIQKVIFCQQQIKIKKL